MGDKDSGDKTPLKKSKVSREAAEAEFDKLAESWDLDVDEEYMEEETKISFYELKRRIVRAIQRGDAKLTEEYNIRYDFRYPSQDGSVEGIEFRIPKGVAYMNMDNYKDRQNMAKMAHFMSNMAKGSIPPKFFSNIDARDLKVCMGVALLFLGS